MPSVSAVIPLFNKGRYIRRALDSVLRQTVSVFEVIVVDDGSTDDGADVATTVKDPRIRLFRQANAGVSAARNRGIAEARSELTAFLDADDEWAPNFIETIVRLRQRHPQCGAYATAYATTEKDGRRLTRDFDGIPDPPWEGVIPNYFHSAHSYPVCASAVAIPRRVFESVGMFPVGVARGEDLDMWCRIALQYPVAFSTQVGAIYHRDADDRVCSRPSAAHHRESRLLQTVDAALHSVSLPSGVTHDDLKEYRNWKFLETAIHYTNRGKNTLAREHLLKCVTTRRFRRMWLHTCGRTLIPVLVRRAARKLGRMTRGRPLRAVKYAASADAPQETAQGRDRRRARGG